MKSVKYEFSIGFKIVSVLCCAFLGGFLWRTRGDNGFGAKWGMFVVATGLSLFALYIFGERQKMQFKLFPILILFTGMTAGGWGTLTMQMSGEFSASALFVGEESMRMVQINPWSGMFLLLCLGFGWMPFFAFFFGHYFSGRKYKFSEILIAIAGYYLVYSLCKMTISHPLAELFCPDAVQLFKDGLADQAMDITPTRYVLEHFMTNASAKNIPGGRNYYATIDAIGSAITALALSLYQRIKLKDKTAFRISVAINAVVAFAITAAALPMSANKEMSILKNSIIYNLTDGQYLWSFWEYGTGFLLGLGFMIICHIAHKKSEKKSLYIQEAFPPIKGTIAILYYSLVALFAPLSFTLIRPFGSRLDADEGSKSIIIMAITSVIVFAFWLIYVSKNMSKKGKALETPIKTPFAQFCGNAFIIYFLLVATLYFAVGSDATIFVEKHSYITVMMVVSFVFIILSYVLIRMQIKKLKEK